ncbi:hypothetical protein GA0115260_107945 [Streptomyces sp. MnatMP-M27]|nr:hypothetical protein GA0115260_107945 [Streptomyces sp. MnatMP-M27]
MIRRTLPSGIPGLPPPRGEIAAGNEGVGMISPKHSYVVIHQPLVHGRSTSRIPHLPS